MEKSTFAYSNVPMPERQNKPRSKGQTMMIDWGIPYNLQLDLIESQGLYVDEAKIAGSIAGVMPEPYLEKKIKAYKNAGIFVFPGGLFAELALVQGTYENYLKESTSLGFSGIEVSDNLITLPPEKKRTAIKKAVDFGLVVMGEVGRKEGGMSGDEIISDCELCLEAGCKCVLIEAHELFHGDIREDVIDELMKRIPPERLMFELPVQYLPDVTKSYKTKILFWMVARFGTHVNLANVEWDEIYFTEISRRGASGDTSHPEGAYRLAGVEN